MTEKFLQFKDLFANGINLFFSLVGKKAQNLGMSFLTFIILYNNLIPISLTVTLEVCFNDIST